MANKNLDSASERISSFRAADLLKIPPGYTATQCADDLAYLFGRDGTRIDTSGVIDAYFVDRRTGARNTREIEVFDQFEQNVRRLYAGLNELH